MSDESDFLRAIAARPDDDAPGLVFADWLEERGDWRAPLLRLACTWRAQEADRPSSSAVAGHWRKLLAALDRTWGMPVAAPPAAGPGPRVYTGPVRPDRTHDW